MGHQGLAGTPSFTWHGAKSYLIVSQRVLLIISMFLVLKKLTFELARDNWRYFFIPFLVKGAQDKNGALTSNIHLLTIFWSIWKNPFSLTPYEYNKCLQLAWVAYFDSMDLAWANFEVERFLRFTRYANYPTLTLDIHKSSLCSALEQV